MQFDTLQELQALVECLDYEWLNKLKWGGASRVRIISDKRMELMRKLTQSNCSKNLEGIINILAEFSTQPIL